ncbi:MAG: hypothetical protein LBN24_06920 [Mediterranea sp.]|jgi:hypothetical protein|nr:hypothetical protein [Mediterranea sp.]
MKKLTKSQIDKDATEFGKYLTERLKENKGEAEFRHRLKQAAEEAKLRKQSKRG